MVFIYLYVIVIHDDVKRSGIEKKFKLGRRIWLRTF